MRNGLAGTDEVKSPALPCPNVSRWTAHRLRHTAGTEIRRRYGVEAARIVLGHRSIDVTQIYAEADRRQARRIAAEMG